MHITYVANVIAFGHVGVVHSRKPMYMYSFCVLYLKERGTDMMVLGQGQGQHVCMCRAKQCLTGTLMRLCQIRAGPRTCRIHTVDISLVHLANCFLATETLSISGILIPSYPKAGCLLFTHKEKLCYCLTHGANYT